MKPWRRPPRKAVRASFPSIIEVTQQRTELLPPTRPFLGVSDVLLVRGSSLHARQRDILPTRDPLLASNRASLRQSSALVSEEDPLLTRREASFVRSNESSAQSSPSVSSISPVTRRMTSFVDAMGTFIEALRPLIDDIHGLLHAVAELLSLAGALQRSTIPFDAGNGAFIERSKPPFERSEALRLLVKPRVGGFRAPLGRMSSVVTKKSAFMGRRNALHRLLRAFVGETGAIVERRSRFIASVNGCIDEVPMPSRRAATVFPRGDSRIGVSGVAKSLSSPSGV